MATITVYYSIEFFNLMWEKAHIRTNKNQIYINFSKILFISFNIKLSINNERTLINKYGTDSAMFIQLFCSAC